MPVAEPDLTTGPVGYTGGRVLAVASDHSLARQGSASLEDLADHHVADLGPDAPEYWGAAMVPLRTPLGRRIPRGPTARTFHAILFLVATGACVHPLDAIAARYNNPPGVTFLPLHDAPTLQWALTWRSTIDNPAIRAFAQTATSLGPALCAGWCRTHLRLLVPVGVASTGRESPMTRGRIRSRLAR
ncbi:LysR substrate-binding domain-containing protein [Streptomyces sp. cg35]|uniref:LysR substrate-binding domain-containing protein n=1 Tax=Streptomyces sp. cg35 TaxID=3421650 RepID=UPI003D1793C9